MQSEKVLIVDDDKFVNNIYRHKFGLEGFTVEVAVDGEAALATVESFKPDVVILDLMLPKINGVEVLRRLRSNTTWRELPVLVITNSYLNNLIQEAWKAGASKCISKTDSTPKVVFELVRDLIAKRKANIEVERLALEAAQARKPQATAPSPAAAGEAAAARDKHFSIDDDRRFRHQIGENLVAMGPATVTALQELVQQLVRATDERVKTELLAELSRKTHDLAGSAAVAEARMLARLASAFEVLIGELFDKPENVNPSTLRTVGQTVDFLGKVLQQLKPGEPDQILTPLTLVVDDEPLSRRAVVRALAKGDLMSVNVDEPQIALKLLSHNPFDLVTLDIDMPGMSGLDLCKQMRTLPLHKETPAIFITNMGDFQNRAKSALSGGNDFIAKPFPLIELTLKALIHILRRNLARGKEATGVTRGESGKAS